MFTRPVDLDEQELAACVRRRWNVDIGELTYSPVGFGSHHWVGSGAAGTWFVTVDDLDASSSGGTDSRDAVLIRLRAAFRTAATLAAAGLRFVVAPVPDVDGEVLHGFNPRYSVVLHPFLEGAVPDNHDGEFSRLQDRRAVVDLLADLHAATPAVCDIAVRDDLSIPLRAELIDAIADLGPRWDTGPYGERARMLLDHHAADLSQLMSCFDVLAERVNTEPDRSVITHGEPGAHNTLIVDGAAHLVDWESARLVAPERDLWDLDPGDGSIIARYEHHTGTRLRRHALDAYRLWYDLFEIAGYIQLFRHPHDDTADAAESWKNLVHFLNPGERWPHLL